MNKTRQDYDREINSLYERIKQLEEEKELNKNTQDSLPKKWWKYKFGVYEIIFYPRWFINNNVIRVENFYHKFNGVKIQIMYNDNGEIEHLWYENGECDITTEDIENCEQCYGLDNHIKEYITKIKSDIQKELLEAIMYNKD